jgi:hypothetical protein
VIKTKKKLPGPYLLVLLFLFQSKITMELQEVASKLAVLFVDLYWEE